MPSSKVPEISSVNPDLGKASSWIFRRDSGMSSTPGTVELVRTYQSPKDACGRESQLKGRIIVMLMHNDINSGQNGDEESGVKTRLVLHP